MPANLPYRLAYVDTAEDLGGAEKSLLEMTARLDRTRYLPLLLHTRDAVWLQREDAGHLECTEVFAPGGVLERKRDGVGPGLLANLKDLAASAGPVCRVAQGLRQVGAHLVHTNSLKAHFLGAVAARLTGLPLIWHMRDLLEEGEGLGMLRRVAGTFKPRVIAISAAVATQFTGLPLRVDVIPNGVPLERFTPGDPPPDLREELGLAPGDRVICCLSRLTPWKGHRTLLKAFARLLPTCPSARLMVVGEPAFWSQEYVEELRALAADLGVTERVIWTGFRSDTPALLRLSDLLVMPSRNEPFGRVLIEAMATGKPVIATNSGGAPEIVLPEETGLLVPPEQPEPLAEALARLLGDAELAARLGQAGLARAQEHFNVQRVAEQVMALYAELLR